MLEDQGKLAGELREILLRSPSLWPPVDLTAATKGVAAAVQVDGGLGLWASDPAGSTKPYRTRRADSKPVYQSPDPVQAAAVAAALNEVTWNQVKKATNFDIDHLAFLADLADSRSLAWLPAGAAKDIRRIADDVAPHIDRILEGQASMRQRALPGNLRRTAERLEAR